MANVAKKYAKALFDTAKEKALLDQMYEEFSTIDEAVRREVGKLKELDTDTQKDVAQRQRFVAIIFGHAHQYLQNMFMVLASNRHITYTHEISLAFKTLYNAYHDQDLEIIESVYEPSEDEIASIDSIIRSRTKLSKLMITNEINPDLIGGIQVKVGTKVMDASIKNDLPNLKSNLLE